MSVLKLSEIWVYPIKSLGGIRCSNANVREKGLEFDRRWMLIDEHGKFMTQRTFPAMALLQIAIDNEYISVQQKKNNTTHSFRTQSYTDRILQANVWRDTINTFEVSKETSAWFSNQLGISCKLVFFPEENKRQIDPDYAGVNDHVSLADGFPFLIIGQASLDDLNQRLSEPVPTNRFRPNLVFTGGLPYEEDGWRKFTIGDNRFVGVKNCSRCVLLTVNQETGQKGEEPLRTLSTYRKRGSEVYFGQNVLALDYGQVSVGDVITFDK